MLCPLCITPYAAMVLISRVHANESPGRANGCSMGSSVKSCEQLCDGEAVCRQRKMGNTALMLTQLAKHFQVWAARMADLPTA